MSYIRLSLTILLEKKIRKQRLLHGLEKEKFCEMINTEEKSLELWESHKIIPAPKSIKKYVIYLIYH